MKREFPASRARMFEFFADAARLREWWGPRGFGIPSIDFAPRVGARYRIEMKPPEADAFHLSGTFREVDPPSRLAFSFEWEPADPDDVETVVELSFREVDGSTEVALAQGQFKTDSRCALHRDGWTESFDKLGELLAQ
jgi:uncharacterized protein YndB with AHSA1/START domain